MCYAPSVSTYVCSLFVFLPSWLHIRYICPPLFIYSFSPPFTCNYVLSTVFMFSQRIFSFILLFRRGVYPSSYMYVPPWIYPCVRMTCRKNVSLWVYPSTIITSRRYVPPWEYALVGMYLLVWVHTCRSLGFNYVCIYYPSYVYIGDPNLIIISSITYIPGACLYH